MSTANAIFQTSTSEGTGKFSLSSKDGWRGFSDKFAKGGSQNDFHYSIRHNSKTEFEAGEGHLDSNGDLIRDTIHESTNNDNKEDFSSGDKDITNSLPASALPPGFGNADEVLKMDSSGGAVEYKTLGHQTLSGTVNDSHHVAHEHPGDRQVQSGIDDDQGNTIYDYSNQYVPDSVLQTTPEPNAPAWTEDGNSPVTDTTGVSSHKYTMNSNFDLIFFDLTLVSQSDSDTLALRLNGDTGTNYAEHSDGSNTNANTTEISLLGFSGDTPNRLGVTVTINGKFGTNRCTVGIKDMRRVLHTDDQYYSGYNDSISSPIDDFTVLTESGGNFDIKSLRVYGLNYS